MSGVITFADVSHWNAGFTPNGPLFAKATQGAAYTDPTYNRLKSLTQAGGWPFAAYHYVTTQDSAMAQAKHALAVIGKNVPVMWDVEKGSGQLHHVLDIHDAYKSLGGHSRLLYLPHWYWQQIGSPSLKPVRDRGLLLVSSNYPGEGYTDNGPGWQSYGGMSPTFWQFTNNGVHTHVDMNAFRGTVADMAKLLARPKPTTPKPRPKPKYPDHVVTTGDTLSSIAKKWGVSLAAVKKANPKAGHPAGNFDMIHPGDHIKHP